MLFFDEPLSTIEECATPSSFKNLLTYAFVFNTKNQKTLTKKDKLDEKLTLNALSQAVPQLGAVFP
jgi:hypothetical protein